MSIVPNLDDFSADEISLSKYIYTNGMHSAVNMSEALGWTPEWVEHVAGQLVDRGVLKMFGSSHTNVYRTFFRGGPIDGLQGEMAVPGEGERVVFTLTGVSQSNESILVSNPDREFPSGVREDGSIILLIGKMLSESSAGVYVYILGSAPRTKSTKGLILSYDRIMAHGTIEQMQNLLDAQMKRITK